MNGTTIEQFARDLGMDPRDVVRDFGEREAAMMANMWAVMDQAETKKPTQFLPLKSRNGEFGVVGCSIPESLFGVLLNRGKGYDLMGRLTAQDHKEIVEEFPICRTETVSGKVVAGTGSKPSRQPVRFDRGTITLAK